jgi:hypothetical protein
VVRNHEVGTGLLVWLTRGRRRGGDIVPGVDAAEHVDEGAMRSDDTRAGQRCLERASDRTNPMRGRSVIRPGRVSEALKGSEDHWRSNPIICHREVMGDEDGARSRPSRVRRATGKAEEGAGNDQGPATTARW